MVRQPPVLQVFIFKDGRFWGTELFAQPQVAMGRSPDADLQLDDDVVSRNHAVVHVEQNEMVLEDLNSANGTFVNGEPVERCYLSARDEVSLGSYSFKFKILSRKQAGAGRTDETRVLTSDLVIDDATAEIPVPVSPKVGATAEESVTVPGSPTTAREDKETGVVIPEGRRPSRESIPAQPEAMPGRGGEGLDAPTAVYETPPLFEEEVPLSDRAAPPTRAQPDRRQEILDALQQETGRPAAARQSPAPASPPVRGEARERDRDSARRRDSILAALKEETEAAPPSAPVVAAPGDLDVAGLEQPGPAPAPAAPVDRRPSRESLPAQPEPVFEPAPAMAASAFGAEEPEPPLEGAVSEEPYDDDDEDYQPDFVEPFSLLNNLIREKFAHPSTPTVGRPAIEVIGYTSDKNVVRFDQVSAGKRYKIGPEKFVLAHFKDNTNCQLMFTESFSGRVISGGQTVPVDGLKTDSNQVKRKRGQTIYGYNLMEGDYANLVHEGGGSFLRFIQPPKLPPARSNFQLDLLNLKIFGSAFVAHVLFLVVLGIFSKPVAAGEDVDLDRFAKVAVKYVEMEKPEEEVEVPLDQLPEPEKTEENTEEKKEEPKEEKKPKKTKKRKGKRRKATGSGGGGGGGVGMMAALGNLSQKKSSRNIVAAVSNLDAVRVPGGRSRFKVSGLVTKLPTSSVVVSRGRGVGVKAGIDLLRGGKGRGGRAGIGPGALGGGKAGRRGVGGVVFKAPKRRMKVRGHLSREAIAKVVRAHLREVQYCYEKALLMNSNLQGKVVMEWTIATSGKVTVVKTKQNTMATPAVAMCISAKIKTWKFPKPKGGIVVVKYPFIFNTVGF